MRSQRLARLKGDDAALGGRRILGLRGAFGGIGGRRAGAVTGIMVSVSWAGIVIMPVIFGALADYAGYRWGYGAGVFLSATVFRLNLDVATDGTGGARLHAASGFRF